MSLFMEFAPNSQLGEAAPYDALVSEILAIKPEAIPLNLATHSGCLSSFFFAPPPEMRCMPSGVAIWWVILKIVMEMVFCEQ